MRRTLSVRPSVCLSVRLSVRPVSAHFDDVIRIVCVVLWFSPDDCNKTIDTVFVNLADVRYLLFCLHVRGPHIVRRSQPHKLV